MWRNALALVWVASLGVSAVAQNAEVPSGRVPDLVRARCVTCHGLDLIQQQRLPRAGWERELDKMIRWGAVVQDDERSLLLEYFLANAGRPAVTSASPVPGARGSQIFADRCQGCHGTDIVEQQRLGSVAWAREVDKMIRWGALVDPADKDPLVTFLVASFGIR